MTSLAVIGMATSDTYMQLDSWNSQNESVNIVSHVLHAVGGKGLLAARSARRAAAGMRVALYAEVGLRGSLWDSLRIEWPDLARQLDNDSQVWVQTVVGGPTVTFVKPGQAIEPTDVEESLRKLIVASTIVYISAERLAVIEQADLLLRLTRVPFALNVCEPLINMFALAGRAEDLLSLTRRASVLLLNQAEEAHLFEVLAAPGWSSIMRAGAGQELVVTMGEAGGRISFSGQAWTSYEVSEPLRLPFLVGAGDAFAGAYLAARFGRQCPPSAAASAASEAARQYLIEINAPTRLT